MKLIIILNFQYFILVYTNPWRSDLPVCMGFIRFPQFVNFRLMQSSSTYIPFYSFFCKTFAEKKNIFVHVLWVSPPSDLKG